jgi:hypothetical protein
MMAAGGSLDRRSVHLVHRRPLDQGSVHVVDPRYLLGIRGMH